MSEKPLNTVEQEVVNRKHREKRRKRGAWATLGGAIAVAALGIGIKVASPSESERAASEIATIQESFNPDEVQLPEGYNPDELGISKLELPETIRGETLAKTAQNTCQALEFAINTNREDIIDTILPPEIDYSSIYDLGRDYTRASDLNQQFKDLAKGIEVARLEELAWDLESFDNTTPTFGKVFKFECNSEDTTGTMELPHADGKIGDSHIQIETTISTITRDEGHHLISYDDPENTRSIIIHLTDLSDTVGQDGAPVVLSMGGDLPKVPEDLMEYINTSYNNLDTRYDSYYFGDENDPSNYEEALTKRQQLRMLDEDYREIMANYADQTLK